jgi:hypothetical protein
MLKLPVRFEMKNNKNSEDKMKHDIRVDTTPNNEQLSILHCIHCGRRFGKWVSNEQVEKLRSENCQQQIAHEV